MCLNELDLSSFLAEQTPVPHDVEFLVEDAFDRNNNTTLKAHKFVLNTITLDKPRILGFS